MHELADAFYTDFDSIVLVLIMVVCRSRESLETFLKVIGTLVRTNQQSTALATITLHFAI